MSKSCLAADAVAAADPAALGLVAVVAAYWLSADLALQACPALADSPVSSVCPVAPGVSPPEQSIREAETQLMYQGLEMISPFYLRSTALMRPPRFAGGAGPAVDS